MTAVKPEANLSRNYRGLLLIRVRIIPIITTTTRRIPRRIPRGLLHLDRTRLHMSIPNHSRGIMDRRIHMSILIHILRILKLVRSSRRM